MSFTLPTISALGTSWWIEVFDETDEKRRQVIHDDCAAFLHTFENQYSRFKSDSDISQLNTNRILQTPGRELRHLLSFGCNQYDRTDGIFNIMVGGALVDTGYDAAYSFIPKKERGVLVAPNDTLTITEELITLGTGLVDIGGFGKGYAIDAIAALLRGKYGLQYFLINGGGDMYATSDQGTPISIYLEHPTLPGTYVTSIKLLNQGFAASSPHKRAWHFAGTTYTHIIDTSLVPALNRLDATFITAVDACTADIFATVALIATSEQMNLFAEREQLGVASFRADDDTFAHNQAFIDGLSE